MNFQRQKLVDIRQEISETNKKIDGIRNELHQLNKKFDIIVSYIQQLDKKENPFAGSERKEYEDFYKTRI